MKWRWDVARQTSADRQRADLRRRQRDARPAERVDRVSLTVAALTVLLLVGIAWLIARSEDRAGQFDPPAVRPLPDARILENLRDGTAPFVAAVALGNGAGDVVVARRDGTLTQVNPVTGVLRSRANPLDQDGLESPLALLSAGCGWIDPTQTGCADPDALFAVTEGGGLAERQRGNRWRTLVSDRPWTGLTGKPVQQQAVIGWAASDDGRFVVVNAGAEGLGLFDQNRAEWIVPEDQQALLDAAKEGSVHIVPEGDVFWFASRNGLGRLRAGAGRPALEWSEDRATAFLHLTETRSRGVMAVIERRCPGNGAPGCRAVVEVRGLDAWTPLIGEENLFGDLATPRISHVAEQDGRLITIGQDGIYRYDPTRRSWSQLSVAPVDSYFVETGGARIHAAMNNEIVTVRAGNVSARLADRKGPFTQIMPMPGGGLIGLNDKAELHDLTADKVLGFRDPGAPPDAMLRTGAAVGDTALALGPAGALVHDIANRRYSWIPGDALDPALKTTDMRLIAAAGRFWLVRPRQGAVYRIAIAGAAPDQTLSVDQVARLPGPLRDLEGGRAALRIVAGDGRSYRIMPMGDAGARAVPRIGSDRQGDTTLRFMAGTANRLFASDGSRVWNYDVTARDWSGPVDGPGSEAIRDLAIGRADFVLGSGGGVYRREDSAWDRIFSRGEDAEIGLAQITDARAEGDALFLAGRGRVQRYDTQASAFRATWQGGAARDVRVVDIWNGLPVWLSGGRLMHGEEPMTGAFVESAFRTGDGFIAVARDGIGGRLAVHFRTPDATPVCTFFGAPAPAGTVRDVAALPDGRVLAATEGGVGLYVPQQRRWVAADALVLPDGGRYHITPTHLIAVSRSVLRTVALSDLVPIESCAVPEYPVGWAQDFNVRSAAYNAGTGQAALLGSGGDLAVWSAGKLESRLGRPNTGPVMDDLRGVVQNGNGLLFSTYSALWAYDAGARRWKTYPLQFPVGAISEVVEVDVTDPVDGRARVTVWLRDGRSLGGTWTAAGEDVDLSALQTVSLARIDTPASEIEDIAAREGLIAVGARSGIAFGDPGSARLTGRLRYAPGSVVKATPLMIGATVAFVEGDDMSAPAAVHILPQGSDPAGLNGTLAQLAFHHTPGTDRTWGLSSDGAVLWRVAADGSLHACDVIPGKATPETCKPVLSAPLSYDPVMLEAAVRVDNALYMQLGNDLLRLDVDLRNPVPVRGLTGLGQGAEFYRYDETLLARDPASGALYRVRDDQAALLAVDVDQIGADGVGLILAQGDRLRRITADGRDVPFATADGDVLQSPGYDWVRGGVPAGLDASGVPVIGGRVLDDVPALPAFEPIHRVFAVPSHGFGPAGAQTFYVQYANGQVQGWTLARCSAGDRTGLEVPCYRRRFDVAFDASTLGPLRGLSDAAAHDLLFDSATVTQSADPQPVLTLRDGVVPAFGRPAAVPSAKAEVARWTVAHDGRGELAPARLNNTVSVLTGMRSYEVRASVSNRLARWNAWDHGWIGWDRETEMIRFQGPDRKPILMPADEAMPEGIALPMHPGRASMTGPGGEGHAWINRFGLWHIPKDTNGALLISTAGAADVVALDKGRFLLTGANGIDPVTGAAQSDGGNRIIDLGSLRVQENLRDRQVSAIARRADASGVDPVFAAQGFLFDQRHAVGWFGPQITLASAMGLVSASALDGFDPGPGTGRVARVLQAGGDRVLLAADRWFSRPKGGTAGWTPLPGDPTAARIAAQIEGATWRIDARGLVIAAAPDAPWKTSGTGLAFDIDQLQTLTGDRDTVLLATGLGTHVLRRAAELSDPGNAVTQTPPGAVFDMVPEVGQPNLFFARSGGAVTDVWDSVAQRWRAAAGVGRAPWARRKAIDTAQFELTFNAAPAGNAAYRTVETLTGASRRASFAWRSGEKFPFDVATALHADRQAVYLGTRFGLRRLGPDGTMQTAIMDIARNTTPNAPAEAIAAVGLPHATPDRILIGGRDGGCAERKAAAAAFVPCISALSLSERRVVETELWSWRKSDGDISGVYKLAGRGSLTISTGLRGRWPHDVLRGQTTCGGTRIELWEDGRHLRDQGQLIALPPDAGGWAGLHCRTGALNLGQGRVVQGGVYLLGSGGAVNERRAQGRWVPIATPLAEGVQAADRGTWIIDRARMRLVVGPLAQSYQLRWRDDLWRAMAWVGGLPQIDVTRGFVTGRTGTAAQAGGLDRVTPLGLVAHDLAAGALRLDPDTLLVRAAAPVPALADCLPERLERLDGSHHATETLPGSPVQFRCADGRVFREAPGAAVDIGALTPLTPDPFAARVLVGPDRPWEWTKSDTQPGKAAFVEARIGEEPLALAGGRFSVDGYTRVLGPFADGLNLIGQGGWWQYPGDGLALFDATRPTSVPAPSQIDAATADRHAETRAPRLCLRGPGGSVALDADGKPERVETCRTWQGGDRFWQYRQVLDGGPVATGVARNGPAISRGIEAGRFADLIVAGAPHLMRETDLRLAVPTRIGAMLLSADGGVGDYLKFDAPAALMTDAGGQVSVLGVDGLKAPRDGAVPFCTGAARLGDPGPDAFAIERLEMMYGERLRAFGRGADGARRAVSIACAPQDARATPLRAQAEVRGRTRHRTTLALAGGATGRVVIGAPDGELRAGDGRDRFLTLKPETGPADFGTLLTVLAADGARNALVLTPEEVFEVDLDRVISDLAEVSPMPQPVVPEATPTADQPAPAPSPPQTPDPAPTPTPRSATPQTDLAIDEEVPVRAPEPPSLFAPEDETLRDPPEASIAGYPGPQPPDTVIDLRTDRQATRRVQTALVALGLLNDTVDGLAGPKTRAALGRYLKASETPRDAKLTVEQYWRLTGEVYP